MRLLTRLHSSGEPPGLEWTILKKRPLAVLMFFSIGARILPLHGAPQEEQFRTR